VRDDSNGTTTQDLYQTQPRLSFCTTRLATFTLPRVIAIDLAGRSSTRPEIARPATAVLSPTRDADS
jgi:hypothetical protein